MEAVIMTGGRGVRMKPYTDVLPKGLLPVGGRPMLDTIVRQLRNAGFTSITMVCGYLSPLIQTYFGSGERWGVQIRYFVEEEPLGTVGALALLPPLTEPVLLMNCDVLTTLDLRSFVAFHQMRPSLLTVASRVQQTRMDLGVLDVEEDRVVRVVEKPTANVRVSMGMYVIDPAAQSYIPQGRSWDIPQLVQTLLAAGEPVRHFASDAYWVDIGRPEDYERANREFPMVYPDSELGVDS